MSSIFYFFERLTSLSKTKLCIEERASVNIGLILFIWSVVLGIISFLCEPQVCEFESFYFAHSMTFFFLVTALRKHSLSFPAVQAVVIAYDLEATVVINPVAYSAIFVPHLAALLAKIFLGPSLLQINKTFHAAIHPVWTVCCCSTCHSHLGSPVHCVYSPHRWF